MMLSKIGAGGACVEAVECVQYPILPNQRSTSQANIPCCAYSQGRVSANLQDQDGLKPG